MFMQIGKLKIPIPHQPVSRDQLKDLLKEAGISEDDWMNV